MRSLNIAIAGATGQVGQELIKLLQQRKFPINSIQLFGTDPSTGRKMYFDHQQLEVKELTIQALKGIDLAFFVGGADLSRYFVTPAAKTGTVVIDTSSLFRMEPNVPLVVPEVNPGDLRNHGGIITSPNPVTVQLAIALNPLHKVNPIKRVIVDSYQSVSSSGTAAMEELSSQSKAILEGKSVIPHVYPHQIAFNLLPEVDVFLDNGYSKEEWKIIEETRKLLHTPELPISTTCVRVPVYIGHSAAVHVEMTRRMSPEEVRTLLAEAPGMKVLDDPDVSLYPQPWSVSGLDDVYAGRVREDISSPHGIAMWVVADNIRKGAALNIIQIAELLGKMNWL